MTREEAISLIKSAQLMLINPTTNEPISDLYEALDIAISALEQNESAEEWYKLFVEKLDEQKPCDDAISREAVLDLLATRVPNPYYENVFRAVDELPPVTPSRRKGRWIKSRDCYGNNHFTCPFCEHDIATKAENWDDNYCPNCGAEMESEEV